MIIILRKSRIAIARNRLLCTDITGYKEMSHEHMISNQWGKTLSVKGVQKTDQPFRKKWISNSQHIPIQITEKLKELIRKHKAINH